MRIALEPARQPEVVQLIDELDAYQMPLYPIESHHGIDLDALSRPEVLFAVIRDDTNAAIGCGAVVLCTDDGEYGELKRMYVRPALRGRGLAQDLLAFLEDQAGQHGCGVFRLETGIRQPEALGLYRKAGYAERGPFGSYGPDPLSVFMEKRVATDVQGAT